MPRFAAFFEIPQELGPTLCGFPVAVAESHKLLAPIRASADHDQAAQTLVMAKTNAGVDAVHPDVDVVPHREIASHEVLPFGLPLFGEPGERRGGQPRLGAEELFESGHEVLM